MDHGEGSASTLKRGRDLAGPVVLMAEGDRGVPSDRRRRDLLRLLANVLMRAIPCEKTR